MKRLIGMLTVSARFVRKVTFDPHVPLSLIVASTGYCFLRWRVIGLVAALVLTSGVVEAADNGIYVGASVAEVSTDYDWRLDPRDYGSATEDTGFKLTGGLRPLDPLAIEINYVDLGTTVVPVPVVCALPITSPCPPLEASLEAQMVSVSAVGLYSFPLMDVFGRVGVARWQTSREGPFASLGKEEGTDLTYGVGAQLRLGSFALRIEYEEFELSRDSADVLSFGFTYTFL